MVRRKALGERWTRENLEMVGGVPWQMGDVHGEDLKLEVTIMDKDYRERMREEATEEAVPRIMSIRKQDAEEHGYTVRCPGCVCVCVDFEGNGEAGTQRRLQKKTGK